MIRLLAVLSIVVAFSSPLLAQEGTERLAPFAHGAGRTYALTARGLDAVEINPALLAYGTPRTFELTLAPFTSIGANTGLNFTTINDVATGLNGDSVIGNKKVTNSIYHNQLSAELGLRVFGLSYYKPGLGAFALTWDIHAAVRSNVPDSVLMYITPPNDVTNFINGRTLTPQHVDVQGVWYHQYGLSYGRQILAASDPGGIDLAGGVTLSYVRGVAYMRVNPSSYVAFNDPDVMQTGQLETDIQTPYEIQFASPSVFNGSLPDGVSFGLISGASAGSGGGISVGLAAAERPGIPKDSNDFALPRWKAGLSLSDLGFIRWSSNTDIRRHDSSVLVVKHKAGDTFTEDSIRSYLNQLSGTLDTSDHPFTSSLPTTLHIAGAIDLGVFGLSVPNASLMLATEFALGLTDVVSSPNKGRFGMAAILDRPSSNIAFRTAIGMTAQDGSTNLTFAIGASLWNRFSLDFGSSNILGFISGNGQSDAALGMKIMF